MVNDVQKAKVIQDLLVKLGIYWMFSTELFKTKIRCRVWINSTFKRILVWWTGKNWILVLKVKKCH